MEGKSGLPAKCQRLMHSGLNRTYTLYGLGVHYVQAWGGRPGMTACVARPNAQNSIDLALIGMDRSHGGPEWNFWPHLLEL
jgi:hypothetical protein